ncbi:MAG: GSCFA domain-containing protein [Candidatus Amulumruptor caecigallinarius]|nr:GSCFA domain-containing protein [Candidatus Amulumruptor caecigallinarius]
MKFRTEYIPERFPFTLSIDRPVLAVGSCFSNNITQRMRQAAWNAQTPLGVLFNPLSIERALRMALFDSNAAADFTNSMFRIEDVYHSFLFDSSFSSVSKQKCIEHFGNSITTARELLERGNTLIVTFGTAWCYFLTGSEDEVVANCHKLPAANFVRRRVSPQEITALWKNMICDLKSRYPNIRIIFTVSPVRHVRDGLPENALSKAVLRLAVNELCSEFECCSYFPAYEILCDDLRDYRFYSSDLVHPSDTAVNYIWEIFKSCLPDDVARREIERGEKIVAKLSHRPIVSGTEAERIFAETTAAEAEQFRLRHPESILGSVT